MFDDSFKALADPTRRQILMLLKERDLSAGEIAEHFTISKPSLTHHLNLLKGADMILQKRSGQYLIYSLNTTVLQDLIGWMVGIWDQEESKK